MTDQSRQIIECRRNDNHASHLWSPGEDHGPVMVRCPGIGTRWPRESMWCARQDGHRSHDWSPIDAEPTIWYCPGVDDQPEPDDQEPAPVDEPPIADDGNGPEILDDGSIALPTGGIETARLTVVAYIDEDGSSCYAIGTRGNAQSLTYLGMTVVAQQQISAWGQE